MPEHPPDRRNDRRGDHRLDRQLDRLVDLLAENATVVLSGTKLASELRVAPSTLWDWVERLRKMGLEIRGLPGSGYQLTKVPDVLTPHAIHQQLPSGEFGRRIQHHYSTGSTMNEAARLATQGAAEGTLIVAEEQTAGRGRLGRQWISEKSAGLYFTLILRPRLQPAAAPILTLLAGVATSEALANVSHLATDLRWPNDVMIRGKKCAGILVEMTAEPERVAHVLVGVGINVNTQQFPEELANEATSLSLEAGRTFSRLEVLIATLRGLEHYCNCFREQGTPMVLERFAQLSSYVQGKRVRVSDGSQSVSGTTEGLTPEGVLLVRRDGGKLERILTGQVRPE